MSYLLVKIDHSAYFLIPEIYEMQWSKLSGIC